MLPYISFIYPYVELPIKFNKSMEGKEIFKDFYNGKQKIDIKINSLYKNVDDTKVSLNEKVIKIDIHIIAKGILHMKKTNLLAF